MSIETILPTGGVGEDNELGRLGMPRWLRRLRAAGFFFGGLGAVLLAALGSGVVAGWPALAGASILVLLAVTSVLAVLVSRRSARAIAARAALVSEAIAGSPDAWLVVAPDGSTAWANMAFRRRFPEVGARPLEAVARLAADEGSAGALRRLEEEAAARGSAEAGIAIRGDDGAIATVAASAMPVPRRPGHVLWRFGDVIEREGVAAGIDAAAPAGPEAAASSGGDRLRTRPIVRDLTSQHEWAEALKRSRLRFQRLFADAPVGMALLAASGRIEEANRALGALLGTTAAELIGRELVDFVLGDDREQVQTHIAEAAAGRAAARPVDVRVSAPRETWAALFIARLEGQVGDEAGLVLHVIDTTEQKNLEVQFAQSQKMQAIGQLAGGVAHDFNNLLTGMIGFCDLLQGRFTASDPSFADIMQIRQNANRAANLVRQLLAFSRQQTLRPTVLDLTEVVAELSDLLRRLTGEKIELRTAHGRDLGLVEVDRGQLEQVVINLVVNARDAMPNGGVLTIRTANATIASPLRRGVEVMPAGPYVLMEVSDSGVGIPRINHSRIFEPFFSTKEAGSGTGLGLSTVYGIVKQTGGFVFVDSEPGAGAQFSIYLPRAPGTVAAPARPAETGEAAVDLTGNASILLVEDEDPVRLFSARALRNKGYRVIEAKSGEAALEIIGHEAHAVDLVISDVVMPRMDGPEMAAKIRERYPGMRVIFISGYAEEAFRDRLAHDAHFLPKPYNLQLLATKVKQVLETD